MPISTTTTAATTTTILLLLLTLAFGNLSPPFDRIYAFGASYTDTGNTKSTTGPSIFRYVSNPPYGCTYFHYPTNRYSDGRLVIDFIAKSLKLPFLPPYLNNQNNKSTNSINYAVAGSTAIPYEFFVKNNFTLDITPQSLQTQLAWFEKTLEGYKCKCAISTPVECSNVFKDALIWVGEIGVNDYAYSLGSTTVSRETIQQLAIQSVTEFLETLLNKGAKYIAVQGLPATGCLSLSLYLSPTSARDDIGCVAASNNQIYIHNNVLQARIQNLRRKYPKAVILYVDYYNAYRYVIKNGPLLGFCELFKVCCGYGGGPYNIDLKAICGSQSSSSCDNPSQYVSWDGLHLTEAMHKVLARLFFRGPFANPSFEYLLRRKQCSN